MKLSEAISVLQAFKKEVGDVDIVVVTELDGEFIVEDRDMEIIEIPTEEDEDVFETVVGIVESVGVPHSINFN